MDDIGLNAESAIGDSGATTETGQLLSLKDGDSFLVADPWGDVCGGVDGMFCGDTRILSRFALLLGDLRPSKLSFALSRDNATFIFHGANHDLPPVGGKTTPGGIIHIERRRCLHQGRMFERLRLTNFGLDEIMAPVSFVYDADFRDMFEVRGLKRASRGTAREPVVSGRSVQFGYDGLDRVSRTGVLDFSEPPWRMSATRADFMFSLAPEKPMDLYIEVGSDEEERPSRARFEAAESGAHEAVRARRQGGARVRAADGAFHAWLSQSRGDVAALTTPLETGPYPYAGIPWFSTPFGRDGIFTAWQMLWLDPSLARGVLTFLASRQATQTSPFADAQPGKIMHETRRGEMAALGEVPFGLYYGGVDTTPLFVALAGAYLRRTGDLDLIRRLWPNLCAAIGWLDTYGDSNGDGFIDYARAVGSGLSNQGWKDSVDSVFHDDARLAKGPIALVEVQGYAYAAWRAMAEMARRLGEPLGEAWDARAERMRQAVEDRFWMEPEGFYAIAIDGEGQLCRPLASNPGHLLFFGLPSRARAQRVIDALLSERFDSGWGLRTLATGSARYNPMSYHNGSIWPHDCGVLLAGMARYGERDGVVKILQDMFEASSNFDMRMPELLCGFSRAPHEPPIAYPVACMPQAWAAGSVFMMLQACLGLEIDAAQKSVHVSSPRLPPALDRLIIEGVEVAGAGVVDLLVHRIDGRVAVLPGPRVDPGIRVVLDG
ncbi:MAG: amylo-alpha-1,6-glucosidase [Caulobacteraceae bacterium]|nr:amylo-alpha-1,6-glucosidase [Caulobacteraceae bacterium]